ncbi:hypothetical protein ACP275_08G217800 [Erythranthe tilingii]
MSSEQARRENVTDERKIEVEKDRVPKMTTHFESLAEKTKGDQDTLLHHHVERVSVPVRVGGVQYSTDKSGPHKEEKQAGFEGAAAAASEKRPQAPSLEEISKMRGAAQQNSMEAIRAAEDRYNKAKDHTTTGHGQGQAQGGGIQIQTNKGGGGALKEKTQQQQQAKDVISFQGQQPKDVTAPKAAAALMEKSQQAKKGYAAQKAMEAKDVISSKSGALSGTAMEKAQQAKGVIAPKAAALKDIALEKGQTAAQYAAEKAKAAKDTAVDTSMVAAQYAGEKAVAAKDVTVESGKGAAGYAGKVAVGVKDQAVVAGWGAAHYTLEKVAEATKTVAGVTSSVAGYTGRRLLWLRIRLLVWGRLLWVMLVILLLLLRMLLSPLKKKLLSLPPGRRPTLRKNSIRRNQNHPMRRWVKVEKSFQAKKSMEHKGKAKLSRRKSRSTLTEEGEKNGDKRYNNMENQMNKNNKEAEAEAEAVVCSKPLGKL